MLGRLEMSVDECIAVYEELMGSIFGKMAHWFPMSMSCHVNGRYDPQNVKSAIEKVLCKRSLPVDSVFNDGIERRCHVYVLVMMPSNSIDS